MFEMLLSAIHELKELNRQHEGDSETLKSFRKTYEMDPERNNFDGTKGYSFPCS